MYYECTLAFSIDIIAHHYSILCSCTCMCYIMYIRNMYTMCSGCRIAFSYLRTTVTYHMILSITVHSIIPAIGIHYQREPLSRKFSREYLFSILTMKVSPSNVLPYMVYPDSSTREYCMLGSDIIILCYYYAGMFDAVISVNWYNCQVALVCCKI